MATLVDVYPLHAPVGIPIVPSSNPKYPHYPYSTSYYSTSAPRVPISYPAVPLSIPR
jgi:hypothetical protein